jgi:hypothetical protein
MPFFWPTFGYNDVSAEAPGKVWIAGVQGSFCVQWFPMTPCVLSSSGNPVVRHWDGARWREYPITGWTGEGRMDAVEAGGGEVWVRGYRHQAQQGYLARFDGRAFVPVAPPDGEQVWTMRSGPGGLWLVTWSPEGRHALYRRTGDAWTPVEVPSGLRWINHLRFRTPTDGWAVGMTHPAPNNYGDDDVPAIAHWDGSSWTSVTPHSGPGPGERLVAVAPVAADDVWAITLRSVIRWNGASWTTVPAPEGMHEPRNLIVDGTGTIWLVAGVDATRSALYRRDGDTWTQVTVPSMTSFTDVAAVPGTDTLWGLSYGDGRPAVVTNTP